MGSVSILLVRCISLMALHDCRTPRGAANVTVVGSVSTLLNRYISLMALDGRLEPGDCTPTTELDGRGRRREVDGCCCRCICCIYSIVSLSVMTAAIEESMLIADSDTRFLRFDGDA